MLTSEEERARNERRELIKRLLRENPRATDRQIAWKVIHEYGFRRCSPSTVNTIRHEMNIQ